MIEFDVNKSHIKACEFVVDDIVRFCRQKQKDFIEGGETESGVDFLTFLTWDNGLSSEQMLAIRPAVENYKEDYKINIKE